MQHPPNYGIIIRIHLVFYHSAILYSILRLLTLSVGPFTVLGWDSQCRLSCTASCSLLSILVLCSPQLEVVVVDGDWH